MIETVLMRKAMYLPFRLLMLGCLLSLSSACGSSTEQQATSSVSPTGEVPATSPASDDQPTSLDEYLGTAANIVRGGGGGAAPRRGAAVDDDELIQQQQLVQQEIQVCMQAQGFEYVPEQVGDGLQLFLGSDRTALSAEDYAATEGFGISTRFDSILEGDVDLTETVDANDEHLATLSEGAADAWQLALRGEPPVRNAEGQLVDPQTGEVVQGRRATGGCTQEAQTIVQGDISTLAELSDEFAELEERIGADARVAEIAREWTACMSAEGFDYQDEQEARAEINASFRPLLRGFFQGSRAAAPEQGGGNGGGGNPLQAIAGLELTPEQELELDTLQDLERALAVASQQCEGDTGSELEAITLRYEAEFIEVNRDALEAFAQ